MENSLDKLLAAASGMRREMEALVEVLPLRAQDNIRQGGGGSSALLEKSHLFSAEIEYMLELSKRLNEFAAMSAGTAPRRVEAVRAICYPLAALNNVLRLHFLCIVSRILAL